VLVLSICHLPINLKKGKGKERMDLEPVRKLKAAEEFWQGEDKKNGRGWLFKMLPLQNRLKKKKDFERVFKGGRGYQEGFLFLKLLKNGLTVSRFGFVVSQKISKKATLRNKIKRRIREAVRKALPNIKPGFDGVWVALKGLEIKDFKETEGIVQKLFQKSQLCH